MSPISHIAPRNLRLWDFHLENEKLGGEKENMAFLMFAQIEWLNLMSQSHTVVY